jgi:hypothetical protein
MIGVKLRKGESFPKGAKDEKELMKQEKPERHRRMVGTWEMGGSLVKTHTPGDTV